MAGIGSPTPVIKDEPQDFQFDNGRFMTSMNGSDQYQQQAQQYGSWQGSMGNDTSDFGMGGSTMRGNYGFQQNMSSNFISGNSVILDDELADLLDPDVGGDHGMNFHNGFGASNQAQHDHGFNDNGFNRNHYGSDEQTSLALPVHQRNQYMSNVYSQTPEGSGPIQSPFVHSFNYAQWASAQPQQQHQLSSQNRRPSSNLQRSSFDMNSRVRNSLQQERTNSNSRSPMTPKTPAINGLQIGTPDSGAYAGQAVPSTQMSRGHRKTPSAQWENTFSSASYIDSPLASPHSGSVQLQISDVVNGGQAGSVSTKVEHVAQSAPPATVEAKRQKRRQSHNAVERRRRDNINDRIQELSRLVPAHRLEGDKLRKHLSSNSPFPTGLSPPQATSLLAGGTGRRAAGSVTQGLPIEEKDKGPAKGDVLNGAVGWTRDLMWLLHQQIRREHQLMAMIERHGDQLDASFQLDDDERRMQSELIDAVQRNGVNSFSYSRTHGSGLWVPKYTDHVGAPLELNQGQIFSNPFSGMTGGSGQDSSMWEFDNMVHEDQATLDFKEEEEFGMEI